MTPEQKKNNLRMALILASVVSCFSSGSWSRWCLLSLALSIAVP
jgi:hypothetical protein